MPTWIIVGVWWRKLSRQFRRREAYPHPYEALKALTRTNQAITEESIKEFIETLNVSEDIKKELRVITPHNYTGI